MTLSNGHCEERGDVAIPNTQEEIASLRSHDITLKNSDPELSGRNHAEGPHAKDYHRGGVYNVGPVVLGASGKEGEREQRAYAGKVSARPWR